MASYCENCGAVLEPGKKFCSQCGANVVPPVSQPQQIYVAPAAMNSPPAPPLKASGQTIALYDQDYDQAAPARPQQASPAPPFVPKSQQEVFAPKPQAVYPPQASPTYPPASSRPAYPVTPPAKSAGSDSLIVTLGLLLLASIPILGLIPAIIFGFKQDAGYRGVLMKAMIAVNLVWTIVLGILFYQFYAILSQVADVNIYWFQ